MIMVYGNNPIIRSAMTPDLSKPIISHPIRHQRNQPSWTSHDPNICYHLRYCYFNAFCIHCQCVSSTSDCVNPTLFIGSRKPQVPESEGRSSQCKRHLITYAVDKLIFDIVVSRWSTIRLYSLGKVHRNSER